MLWIPVWNIRQTRTISYVHWGETPSGGQGEKRGAALARELTCHSTATCCSSTKEPLGEPHQEEKPVGEWGSSIFSEEKTLVYPPWPLCHPWILFTPREVFSLMDPLQRSLFSASRSRHIHREPSPPLCSVSSFYLLNQERCSPSIANRLGHWTFITRWLEVCVAQMWETRERAGEETPHGTTPAHASVLENECKWFRLRI